MPSKRCRLRAHPRSRGATLRKHHAEARNQGPSPLTRGNHAGPQESRRRQGPIPAHAGQPALPAQTSANCGAHPRSRGATLGDFIERSRVKGPSPLTRGNLVVAVAARAVAGPIPAHAGQPVLPGDVGGDHWAHPRSRGATPVMYASSASGSGPSPLTRGNLLVTGIKSVDPRPIPAHAGQPSPRTNTPSGSWAHPRSRGATFGGPTFGRVHTGPSPLTRGNRLDGTFGRLGRGPIPAHAGQPSRGTCRCRSRWAHPRSRGATRPRRCPRS